MFNFLIFLFDCQRRPFPAFGVALRVGARDSAERVGYKIRQARLDKIPYMLVVGAQEAEDRTVSVRSRFAGDEGIKPLAAFIDDVTEEIRTKEIRKEEIKDE